MDQSAYMNRTHLHNDPLDKIIEEEKDQVDELDEHDKRMGNAF